MLECGLSSYQTLGWFNQTLPPPSNQSPMMIYFSTHPPEQFWKEKKRVNQMTSFSAIRLLPPPAPNLATNKHWLKKRWEGKDICNVSSSLSEFSYTVILNVTWTKVISVWGNQAFLFLLASANSSPRSFLSSPLQVLFLSQARKCPKRNEKRIFFFFSKSKYIWYTIVRINNVSVKWCTVSVN